MIMIPPIAASLFFLALSPATSNRAMPVQEVELYETGVGVMVREIDVRGDASPSFTVARGHLDDASKSLMVETTGKVQVDALDFPTPETIGSASVRAGFDAPDFDKRQVAGDYKEILQACIGERLSVQLGSSQVRGMLVVVQDILVETQSSKAEKPKPVSERLLQLAIFGENGKLSKVRSDDIEKIVLLDADVQEKLRKLVATISPRRTREPYQFSFHTHGTGTLRVRYIQETPLWQVNYRLHATSTHGKTQLRVCQMWM